VLSLKASKTVFDSAGEQSLGGLRVLVGRARHQAGALSSELRALGAEVIEIPFIEIRNPRSWRGLDRALRNIGLYDWLILTSVNGVEALSRRLEKMRLRPADLEHLQIAAIGPATRAATEKLGLAVTTVPKSYVAESVVEALGGKVKGKRVLLARAKQARDVIPRALSKHGARVEVVEAYETVMPRSAKERLQRLFEDPKRRPHLVCFTSSSTVRNFMKLLSPRQPRWRQGLKSVLFASIGPITSSTLKEVGLRVDLEAAEYSVPGLVRAIRAQACRLAR
jgi:uroporphyrinogen-III synthase